MNKIERRGTQMDIVLSTFEWLWLRLKSSHASGFVLLGHTCWKKLFSFIKSLTSHHASTQNWLYFKTVLTAMLTRTLFSGYRWRWVTQQLTNFMKKQFPATRSTSRAEAIIASHAAWLGCRLRLLIKATAELTFSSLAFSTSPPSFHVMQAIWVNCVFSGCLIARQVYSSRESTNLMKHFV